MRLEPLAKRALCALLPASLLLCSTTAAKEVTAKLDPTLFGHFNQHNMYCANYGCGPTAAANSFLFLQNTNPDIYTGSKTLIGAPNPRTMFDVTNELGNLMGCTPTQGVKIEAFILGEISYFDRYAPDTTEVIGQMNFGWRSPGGKAKPDGIDDNQKPELSWLATQLRSNNDVELFVGNGDDSVQHYVTLTGISYDDVTYTGKMWIIDPWDGSEREIGIDGLSSGFIDTTYTIDGEPADFVYHAVANLPVPEPQTCAMLLAGLGLLGFMAWRRKQNAASFRSAAIIQ